MSSNKHYNENNVRPFHDKTSHTSSSGTTPESRGTQSKNPGTSSTYGNKQRSRVVSSPGGKLTVPKPVNLPSKRKETKGTDPNGAHFANSSNWLRNEEYHSSSLQNIEYGNRTQSGQSNRHVSWTGPTRAERFNEVTQSSHSVHFNQEEYPTLEAATHPRLQTQTSGVSRRVRTPEQTEHSFQSDSTKPWTEADSSGSFITTNYHRPNWHDDERYLSPPPPPVHSTNEASTMPYPPPFHHRGYYPPVQMYPGRLGRAVVQPQGYYGYVHYTDGVYHPAHPHYYPQMYSPYSQGYLPGEPYPEQDLFPQVNPPIGAQNQSSKGVDKTSGRDQEKEAFELEQRTRALKLAERLKLDDSEQLLNSASDRWNGDGTIRLIKRQIRTEPQKQDDEKNRKIPPIRKDDPERAESLTTLLLKKQEDQSTDLDWDAQVDAEQKKQQQQKADDEALETESTKLDTPSPVEVRQDTETHLQQPLCEWSQAKVHTNAAQEHLTSPLREQRPIPEDAASRERPFFTSGRHRPRGVRGRGHLPDRRYMTDSEPVAGSTPEVPVNSSLRMFPGRGFRPKESPRTSVAGEESSRASPVPDEVSSPTVRDGLIRRREQDGRGMNSRRGYRSRGGMSRGRRPEYVKRGQNFSDSYSPGVSSERGSYSRGRSRGARIPRREGGNHRGSGSPFRGGRRRDSLSFKPRGFRTSSTASPKMQWVPKKPSTEDRDKTKEER
eukprot:g680.t1